MKPTWAMIVVAMAVALAACDTDEFGTIGSELPTDVSQDSLLIQAPQIDLVQMVTVTPDTLQDFDERSRLFLGNRARDGFRASPVIRFDFSEETIRERLRIALLEKTREDDPEGIAAAETFADTVTIAPGLFDDAEMELPVLARDVDRELDITDDAQSRFPRLLTVYETSRPVSGADAPVVATIDEILGDELAVTVETEAAVDIEIAMDVGVVAGWAAAGEHDGLIVYDLMPGDVDYDLPGDSNVLGLVSQSGGSGPEIRLEVADAAVNPVLGVNDIVVEVTPLVDFTVIEQSATIAADEGVIASHRTRRTWVQIDLDTDVIPNNATINQAVMTWYPRVDLCLGTVASPQDSTQITVRAFEARQSEATRARPGTTDTGAGLESLAFVGQSGFSPAVADSFEIDITFYVQRAVNSIVDPSQTGLLVLFDLTELTDLDQAVFHGPSAAPDLVPRVRLTYTPPADSWR